MHLLQLENPMRNVSVPQPPLGYKSWGMARHRRIIQQLCHRTEPALDLESPKLKMVPVPVLACRCMCVSEDYADMFARGHEQLGMFHIEDFQTPHLLGWS